MSIAQATATSAIENNSIPSLLFQAGQLALAAYTAHKVYKVYEQEGVKAALKELGYEVVIGVATDQALKVAGTGLKALAKTQAGQATIEAVKHSKVGEIVASGAQATQEIAYKIGDKIYHDAEAAWKAVLAQHPDLEKKFARHLGRFDAEKEIAARALPEHFKGAESHSIQLEKISETTAEVSELTKLQQQEVQALISQESDKSLASLRKMEVEGNSQMIALSSIAIHSGQSPENLITALKGAKGKLGQDLENFLVNVLGGTGEFNSRGRNFDGAINDLWYEVKSGNYWKNNYGGKGFSKFKSDMADRLTIATNNGKEYQLISNTAVSEDAKTWLLKKNIKFLEILE